ncbi:MAG: DUF3325 family protein [Hyphomicrobiales bacterium]|jgi:hypothetical protein|nr:DUF3325 family protein [Hyphomicrobiales bacterium]
MSHVVALMFSLAGFAALACASRRQQRDLFGGSLGSAVTLGFRLAGGAALLGALAVLVAWHGWGLALVMYSGHTSLAAGIVGAVLIVYGRSARPKFRPR